MLELYVRNKIVLLKKKNRNLGLFMKTGRVQICEVGIAAINKVQLFPTRVTELWSFRGLLHRLWKIRKNFLTLMCTSKILNRSELI